MFYVPEVALRVAAASMPTLKVVCLISGGKDSFFSILHCLKNGHEVVALANLHPPADSDGNRVDDSDSYMYQTIGHAVIPLYEQALGLPLYRQEISGTHVNHDKSYGPPIVGGVDETEDLVPLLQKVKAAHPDVNAVNTGAILSDYQRTRVESVAIRLGLVPLAYLWQWPNLPPHTQVTLLENMAAVSQDSRIVKVASGGLDETFLRKNVADPQTIKRLERAADRFGSPGDGAALGEGGEYETLAVAGPAPLWKGRITVDEDSSTIIPSGAGAAYLQLSSPRFEQTLSSTASIASLKTPPLLEKSYEMLLDIRHRDADQNSASTTEMGTLMSKHGSSGTAGAHHILLSNLTGEGVTPAQQTNAIMGKALTMLQGSGHAVQDIAYTSIILRDMADFASINAVYGSYFIRPNPPARLTIACSAVLPKGKDVMMSLTSVMRSESNTRRALHVQSRSYWAPANIGPYSQAVSVYSEYGDSVEDDSIVYIAGQIPLVPSTMELPGSTDSQGSDLFTFQTVLALQHFVRIGRVMQVRQWAAAMAFITASSSKGARTRTSIVRRAWEGFHSLDAELVDADGDAYDDDDSESFDVWDLKFGDAKQSDRALAWRNLSIHDPSHIGACPPLYVIQVDSLPRGASVEWATYGLTKAVYSRPRISHLDQLLQLFEQQILFPINE